MLAALLAATLTFSVVSELVVGAVISAARGTSYLGVISHAAGLRLLNLLGNTCVGIGVVALARWSPITLAVLPPVLVALSLLYRTTLRSTQEADAWQQLNTAADELSRLDEELLSDAIVYHAQRLFRPDRAELLGGLLLLPCAAASPEPPPSTSLRATARLRRRSAVDATLDASGDRLGVLRLLWERPVHWTGHEQQVLEAYAHTAASRLSTARLRAQAEEFAAPDGARGLARPADRAAEPATAARTGRRRLCRPARGTANRRAAGAGPRRLQAGQRRARARCRRPGAGQVGRRLARAVRTGDLVARLGGDEFAVLATGIWPAWTRPSASPSSCCRCWPARWPTTRSRCRSKAASGWPASRRTAVRRRVAAAAPTWRCTRRRPSAGRPVATAPTATPPASTGSRCRRDAAGAGERAAAGLLPAGDRPAHRRDRPRRGVDPVGPPGPRAAAAGGIPAPPRALRAGARLHPARPEQATRDCVELAGVLIPSLGVAINLSARTLLDTHLPAHGPARLSPRHDLPPTAITLELTETAVTHRLPGRWRDAGARCATSGCGSRWTTSARATRR